MLENDYIRYMSHIINTSLSKLSLTYFLALKGRLYPFVP